jgi:hypothetical protein
MNYHVYGPLSVRHNDLYSLYKSDINSIISDAQRDQQFQYVVYGDSAYIVVELTHIRARHDGDNLPPELVSQNKALSSCREVIEWDYGNIGTMWKFIDYKKACKSLIR